MKRKQVKILKDKEDINYVSYEKPVTIKDSLKSIVMGLLARCSNILILDTR